MSWLTEFDVPPLADVNAGEWVDLKIDIGTGRKGQNDKGWKILKINIALGDSGFENQEVPFWAVKSLVACLKKSNMATGVANLRYRRTVDGKKSTAEFSFVDADVHPDQGTLE